MTMTYHSSIKPKKKICKSCGEENYIFSKGRCKRCASVDYVKNSQKKANSTPKKRLSKKPTQKHVEAKKRELEAMQDFWAEHQDTDLRCNCFECGKSLAFDRTHCAHLLSKGAYPQLRDNKKNFIILCLEHHQQFDFGERSQMKVWPYVETVIEELKNEFYFFEKEHH